MFPLVNDVDFLMKTLPSKINQSLNQTSVRYHPGALDKYEMGFVILVSVLPVTLE